MWENYSPKSVYAEFESMFSYSNVPDRSIGGCGSECIPSGGLAIYKSGYLKTGFRDRMVMSLALGPVRARGRASLPPSFIMLHDDKLSNTSCQSVVLFNLK